MSLVAVACGDDHGATDASMPDAASPVDAPPECEQTVGTFVAEHACLHALHGPFDALTASTPSMAPEADVSQPHTAFRIELPALDAGYQGAVRYVPRRGGEIAMFTAPGVTMTVVDAMGRQQPARLDHEALACGELGRVATFALDAGSTYSLALSNGADANALLVIEVLDEFLPSEAYHTTCELPDAGASDAAPPSSLDAASPDAAVADATPATDADCAARLGAAVVEHTCLHVMHGPFGTVTAQADPATATVNINASHTYYTVELLPTDDLYQGVVTYRPTNTGLYVFFLHPDVPARMQEPDGTPVPSLHDEIVTTCPGLTRAMVVELTEAVRYRLIFEPTGEPTARVAVEYLDSFSPEEQWDELCAAEEPEAARFSASPRRVAGTSR